MSICCSLQILEAILWDVAITCLHPSHLILVFLVSFTAMVTVDVVLMQITLLLFFYHQTLLSSLLIFPVQAYLMAITSPLVHMRYYIHPHSIPFFLATYKCFSFQSDDLKVVVSYLRRDQQVSRIGLWGRSMGAVTRY